MNFFTFLQTLLNIFFVAALGYCFLRFKREDQSAGSRESYKGELAEFKNSLEKTIEEGHLVSNRILENIEAKQKTLSQLGQLVETEKNSLKDLLEEIKSANTSSGFINHKFQEPWINDNYAKAVKLSAEGFSPKEIADRIKLPLGEVELVLSLRK